MVRFDEAVRTRRILVCVGSGGVGKTTTAATLALAAARRGRRTLVLTIDPAKRLANSLGLAALGHEPMQVPPSQLGHPRPADAARGELWAMMLDQKAAFDEVVTHHARDPLAVKRILANPVYGQVSGTLAGAQEYAAMAKLHEFHRSGQWDLIVVDTPPTAHALDFLDAPRKLSEAIDSPAIEWFRKAQASASRWSLVGKTGGFVLKQLAKFIGAQFVDDIGVFFSEFNDILGGFRARAEEVFDLLRQPSVGFVLVASPEAMAIAEATYFHDRLRESTMRFEGFVVNKTHAVRPLPADGTPLATTLATLPGVAALGLSQTSLRIATEALQTAHSQMEIKAHADRAAIAQLAARLAPGQALIEVPMFRADIHDVHRLLTLEAFLLQGP